jgi:hypothetical protein
MCTERSPGTRGATQELLSQQAASATFQEKENRVSVIAAVCTACTVQECCNMILKILRNHDSVQSWRQAGFVWHFSSTATTNHVYMNKKNRDCDYPIACTTNASTQTPTECTAQVHTQKLRAQTSLLGNSWLATLAAV